MIKLVKLASTVLCLGTIACTSAQSEIQSSEPKSPELKPNIVLVITDDQGKGDLGAYENPVIQTPQMDALYNESVRLENFHVDPTCSPSRSALLTGQQSLRAGVWHTIMGRNILPADKVTLPEILQANGYHTGLFGKWHLGDNYPFRPEDQGFETVIMHGGGGVGQTPDFWGNTQFGDTYYVNGKPTPFAENSTDVWFNEAEKFVSKSIKEQKNSASARPFFAYIATNAPHSPYRAPQEYMDRYEGDNLSNPVTRFYAMVTHIDDRIGQLRELLKKTGTERDTIFIFMTDNGSAMRTEAGLKNIAKALKSADQPVPEEWENWTHNAGLPGHKGSVEDGGHLVPFFIRWPAKGLEGGRPVTGLTAHFDILPTLIDLLKLDVPEGADFDGTSLSDALQSGNAPTRTLVVTSQRVATPTTERPIVVLTEKWRYFPNGKKLFNVKTDVMLQDDVADKNPKTVAKLHAHFEKWWDTETARLADLQRPIIGSEHEPISRLTSHDFAPSKGKDSIKVAWFPGFGEAVHGEYKSAWLGHESDYEPGDLLLNAAVSDNYNVKLYYHDAPAYKIIPYKYANLEINGKVHQKPLIADATNVAFDVDILAGDFTLSAWFSNEKAAPKEKGTPAFFIYTERNK